MTDAVRRFLAFLHPTDGYRDLRAISSDRKTTRQYNFHTDDLKGVDQFLTAPFVQGLNLFVGVAARRTADGAQLADCSYLRALFLDQDYKTVTPEEAQAKLDNFPFQPTALISSGGGAHPYFGLKRPLDLQSDAPRAKSILRGLARRLGGDLGAATPERILRIPDTQNFKYTPPRPVVLEYLHEDRLYDLDELLEAIGPLEDISDKEHKNGTKYVASLSMEERLNRAKRWVKKQEPAIAGHGGDAHTFNIACTLVIGFDLDADSAMQAIQEWNPTCVPPWPLEDLKTKIQNAGKYGDKSTRGNKLTNYVKKNAPSILIPVAASSIEMKPVRWAWKDRLPLGELALLAGREGHGKSTLGYQLAADMSQGRMEGYYSGTSRAVFIVATEDSWSHTIAPRLLAANADMNKVFRIDAETVEGMETTISLPKDIHAMEQLIQQFEVGMVFLDPLMSRLDSKLDSHKDSEVRQALEPLSKLAHNSGALVLGIIHVNKSGGTDPLSLIMGSRAFSAVSRAVLFVAPDNDDPTKKIMGQPKNNLGKSDLPNLLFTIQEHLIRQTSDGPITTAKLVWHGETEKTVNEEIELANDQHRSQVLDASEWLKNFLTLKNGYAESDEIKKAGRKDGHSESALKRARKRVPAVILNTNTFPRKTYWHLKGIEIPVEAPEDTPF